MTRNDWTVMRCDGGYAVRRGAEVLAVFTRRGHALQAAAILPQLEDGLVYRLARRDDLVPPRYDVTAGEEETVGWIRDYSPEAIEALHVTERIVVSPAELAFLLEAARPEVLEKALQMLEERRSRR